MVISIKFDNPQGVYFPGQLVRGDVCLNLASSVKAYSICVYIKGHANTRWSKTIRRTCVRDGKTHTENFHVDYHDSVCYVSGEAAVWTSGSGSKKISKGYYQYPFQFLLPQNCPPSFEGVHGYIRYEVSVEIDKAWSFNSANRQFFSVAPIFDLNTHPLAVTPITSCVTTNTGLPLFRNGNISLSIRTMKGGYVPGENIVIEASIENSSSKPIVKASIKLLQHSVYKASFGSSTETRDEIKEVTRAVFDLNVPAKTSLKKNLALKVQPVVSSFNSCPIISVSYTFSVKIYTAGSVNNSAKTTCGCLIGTVPVMAGAAQFVAPSPNVYPVLNQTVVNISTPVVPSAPPMMNMDPNYPTPYPTLPQNGHMGVPPYPTTPPSNYVVPSPSSTSPAPMYPSAPPSYNAVGPTTPTQGQYSLLPPSYEESVFGASATTQDTDRSEAFAPRYPFFPNLADQTSEKM